MDFPYRMNLCMKCTQNGFNLKTNPCSVPGCEYYIPTCLVLNCLNKVLDDSTICLECKALESMLRHERQICHKNLHDVKVELKRLAIVTQQNNMNK